MPIDYTQNPLVMEAIWKAQEKLTAGFASPTNITYRATQPSKNSFWESLKHSGSTFLEASRQKGRAWELQALATTFGVNDVYQLNKEQIELFKQKYPELGEDFTGNISDMAFKSKMLDYGSVAKGVVTAAFAIPEAVFSTLNSLDEQQASILSPVLKSMNWLTETAWEMFKWNNAEELEQRQNAGISGWITNGIQSKLFGKLTDGEPVILENIENYKLRSFFDDLWNEVVPPLATLVLFEKGIKAPKRFVKEVLADAEFGVRASLKAGFTGVAEELSGLQLRKYGSTRAEVEVLQILSEAERKGDIELFKAVAKENPKAVFEYDRVSRRTQEGVGIFKEIYEKAKKGEEIPGNLKFSFVDWFRQNFKEKTTVSDGLNRTLDRIDKTMKDGTFNLNKEFSSVMQEVAGGIITHPDFLGMSKVTQLKTGLTSEMKDPQMFAQLGGRGAKKPTGEAAAMRAEIKADEGFKPIEAKTEKGYRITKVEGFADEPTAKRVEIVPEVETFVHKRGKAWVVSEAKSGMALTREFSTRKAAVEAAKAIISEKGIPTFLARIQEVVEKATTEEFLKQKKSEKRRGKYKEKTPEEAYTERVTDDIKESLGEPTKREKVAAEKDKIPKEEFAPREYERLLADERVSHLFKEDDLPDIGFYAEKGRSPIAVAKETILGKELGEKLQEASDRLEHAVQNTVMDFNKAQIEIMNQMPTGKMGVLGKAKEAVFPTKKFDYMFERSRDIFNAIESGTLEKLDPLLKKHAERIIEIYKDYRVKLENHHNALVKFKNRNIYKLEKSIEKYQSFLEENGVLKEIDGVETLVWNEKSGTSKYVWERVESAKLDLFSLAKAFREEARESKGKLLGLANENPRYIHHLVDPRFLDLVRTTMPQTWANIDLANSTMNAKFLAERKGFPFYSRDALNVTAEYIKTSERMLQMDFLIDEMRMHAKMKGYIKGSTKDAFLEKHYIGPKLLGERAGREFVEGSAKGFIGGLYKFHEYLKKNLKTDDVKFVTKILETKIQLTEREAKYLKENVMKPEELKINESNVITLNTMRPDRLFIDNMVAFTRGLSYTGTIAMSPKTSVINTFSQPTISLAYSGLGIIEGAKIMAKAYGEIFSFLGLKGKETSRNVREQMRRTGISMTIDQFIDPSRPEHSALQNFYGKALANISITELIARWVSGRIGQIAFEKGLISKELKGETVEVMGFKLSKGWSDKFNLKYGNETYPLWADHPIGKMVIHLGSFALKNIELHRDLLNDAGFKAWVKKSEEIYRGEGSFAEKASKIYAEWNNNYARKGVQKEIIFGLTMAFALGQVFDLDWNEFLSKGMNFSISNPVTNLFLGAGGLDQGFLETTETFIPFRGAVRNIDKTLGTDILSDYRDYGSVPKLFFNQKE